MQSFVRVVRAGSFTLAAHQLGLSRALISRHVSDLETRLGVRLLTRSTRAIVLTDEGRDYLKFCEQIFRDLEMRESTLAHARSDASGTLRILAPNSFGSLHVADAVIAFSKVQPRLHVSLMLENTWFRHEDFSQRDLDLALRFEPIRRSAMIAEPIAACDWVVCAAPEYLRLHGRLTKPADLATHACLLHSNALPDDHIWRLSDGGREQSVRVKGAMYSNSATTLRKAAVAGLGIALVPRYAVADDLTSGRLVSLLPRTRVPQRILLALYPKSVPTPAKVRLFIDFLAHWIITREIGHVPKSSSWQ
jgi:DNA-binding transcriptional LysR family regulator